MVSETISHHVMGVLAMFENVSVVKKANIYFGGQVTSRTVLFADGTRKTLGILLPGEYEFATADKEIMEIQAGRLDVWLLHAKDWQAVSAVRASPSPRTLALRCASTM